MKMWSVCLSHVNNICKEFVYHDKRVYQWGEIIQAADGDRLLSQQEILQQILLGECDYNKLHGFFKLLVEDISSGEILLLGDNAGSQFFFIDEQTHTVGDSLLKLVERRHGAYCPNYESVSRFLSESRVLTDETVVAGITATNKDFLYTLQNEGLTKQSKGLIPFGNTCARMPLGKLVRAYLHAAAEENPCAVLTGGTDSRTVLAHLLSNGVKPRCILSGRDGNPDIRIARRIASKTALDLAIYNPDDRAGDWILQGFDFSDGIYDTVLAYRHVRLKDMACKAGSRHIFGGVGGEFYKNSFCHFIRNRYHLRRMTAGTLAEDIFQNTAAAPSWFGEQAKQGKLGEQKKIEALAARCKNGTMLCSCNSAGYEKLTKSMSCITNNYARYCIKIDPLMDRDVVAGASGDSPWRHCLGVWQRKEIARTCPEIGAIETDQGLTCSMNPCFIIRDAAKSAMAYCRLAVRKMTGRKNPDFDYWDKDYAALCQSETYKTALSKCRELGIVTMDAHAAVPAGASGRIATLGLLFSGMKRIGEIER